MHYMLNLKADGLPQLKTGKLRPVKLNKSEATGLAKLDNSRLTNISWCNESQFQQQHSDGRVGIQLTGLIALWHHNRSLAYLGEEKENSIQKYFINPKGKLNVVVAHHEGFLKEPL
ncbi:hypothetical protein AMECASPLE_032204 [Ameca splendens]|uniref:Uncharacterized protein n=1 Tax=Ameca splendens TaxID=208324 RepID=A0ABV0XVK5_9TELE